MRARAQAEVAEQLQSLPGPAAHAGDLKLAPRASATTEDGLLGYLPSGPCDGTSRRGNVELLGFSGGRPFEAGTHPVAVHRGQARQVAQWLSMNSAAPAEAPPRGAGARRSAGSCSGATGGSSDAGDREFGNSSVASRSHDAALGGGVHAAFGTGTGMSFIVRRFPAAVARWDEPVAAVAAPHARSTPAPPSVHAADHLHIGTPEPLARADAQDQAWGAPHVAAAPANMLPARDGAERCAGQSRHAANPSCNSLTDSLLHAKERAPDWHARKREKCAQCGRLHTHSATALPCTL